MDRPAWNTMRTTICALPLLLAGCVVVPDGGEVYHAGHRAPGWSVGYASTYGTYPPYRPPAPVYYINRPPPAVVVHPRPVVVVPGPRPPAFTHRPTDRHPHAYREHGQRHGGHDRGEHRPRGQDGGRRDPGSGRGGR